MMAEHKYDIFISYRREGGAQYARILQLMLMQRGYKVFLDYDELTDGVFGDHIRKAIKEAPVFMLVLSKGAMMRCVNEDDWVRQEILLAIQLQKHLIPINPDNSFDGFPEDSVEKEVPKEIREQVCSHQFSEIGFGQTLGVTIDLMVRTRLVPTLGARSATGQVDADFQAAQESLHRQDAHNKFMKRLELVCAAVVAVLTLAISLWLWKNSKAKDEAEAETAALTAMRHELQDRYSGIMLQLSTSLTMQQMVAIDTMLMNMTEVCPDSVWMSQFEFTAGQWHAIKGEPCDEAQRHMPITGVSYADIYMMLSDLADMTNLNVELPSAELWEYASHGGANGETTLYVGDDDVERVAWYRDNSGGHAHASDGQQGKLPNGLDLYDMSGNVGELCNTTFGDGGLFTVCGGDYDSPAAEVTATSRRGFATDARDKHVGFRIIIRKP